MPAEEQHPALRQSAELDAVLEKHLGPAVIDPDRAARKVEVFRSALGPLIAETGVRVFYSEYGWAAEITPQDNPQTEE